VTHPDFDRLLEFCLPFAQQTLKKYGDFHPFAAKVGADGALSPLAIYGDDDEPKAAPVEQYEALLRRLTAEGDVSAVALCYDSVVFANGEDGGSKDAIAVALEHQNGECIASFLPYRKRFLLGYAYDALVAQPAERRFWAEGDDEEST
jgi:hypothetical protein